MSRKMTQKQLDANRRNAQKSTGPRTDRGKARSSRNRTTHGLYSRDLVLTHGPSAEDPAEFDAIRQSFYADFRPASGIERALVERLAACCWRSRRAQRFEAAALARTSSDHVKSVDESRATLASQQALLDAKSSHLEKIKLIHASFLEHPEPGDPIGYKHFQDSIIASAQQMEMPIDGRTPEKLLPDVLYGIQKRITELSMWVDTHRSIVATLHHRIAIHTRLSQTGDLPENEILQKLLRYESLNDRQFHRTLNQLIGHQRKIPLTAVLQEIQSQNPPCHSERSEESRPSEESQRSEEPQPEPPCHSERSEESRPSEESHPSTLSSSPASREPQPEPPCHSERSEESRPSEESHPSPQQSGMASRDSADSDHLPESQTVDSNPSLNPPPIENRQSTIANPQSPEPEMKIVDSNPSESALSWSPPYKGGRGLATPTCLRAYVPSCLQISVHQRSSAARPPEMKTVDSNPSFNATPIENRQSQIANRQFQRTR